MGVIDLAQTVKDASFVRKALQKFGLPADLGSAIAALAATIRDHQHLERLLTDVDGAERQELYDSIAPHLRFKAKPLDVYVSSAGQRAEREQWPVLDGAGTLRPFTPAQDILSLEKQAERLLAADLAKRTLTLTCSKCLKRESFHQVGEETHVDVVIKARKAGWIYDYIAHPPREICPTCPTSLRKINVN